jgi:hypothetical protein
MTILIGKYEFDGPFQKIEDLEEQQGVYVVLHYEDEDFELMRVAHADNIREHLALLPAECSRGKVLLAALYTPECGPSERSTMVQDIESEFGYN